MLCLAVLVFPVSRANADPLKNERFKISGFATLGLTQGGDEILGHRRNAVQDGNFDGDWSFKTDSLLGVQLDTKFTNEFNGAIQLVARERAEQSISDSIEWAYLRYRLNPKFTARVGRIGIDVFMLSEYRNVGFAYLWARPPSEFYVPFAFDYFEGADITFVSPLSSGTLSAKLFLGATENKFEFEGEAREFSLNNGIGGNIVWENDNWKTQFGILRVDLDNNVNKAFGTDLMSEGLNNFAQIGWHEATEIADEITANGERITYYSLGISYNKNPWVIQAEANYYDIGYSVIKSYRGEYLSLGHRFQDVTLFTLLSQGSPTEPRYDAPPVPGILASIPEVIQLQESVQTLFDTAFADQKTFGFGARWNIRHDLALKLQWERTKVEARGSLLWKTKEVPTEDREIDTISVNLNYIFSL